MSTISRVAPIMAKSALFNPTRHMATATASDPVQKLFVDKIREFKSGNQGLDAAHQKAMNEEMARLKRVYQVDDESKLSQYDIKFSNEHMVSLHDLDEQKKFRGLIASDEYQKQLTAEPKPVSAVLATIPEQVTHDLHLPPLNKPDPGFLFDNEGVPGPSKFGETKPDIDFIGEKMTPHRLQRDMNVMFGPDMPTIHDDKKPERDTVNFPRLPINDLTPPTRYHIIPESWFQFFYPKTGVTGPYTFAATFGTFLLSKEWLVWEHELLTGVSSTIIFSYAVIKYGPKCSAYFRNLMDKKIHDWEHWRKGNIEFLNEMQTHYKDQLKKSETIKELYGIREHDVNMQLEGEYRRRLKSVYDDTKRRLNYLVSVTDSQRQIAHKNMVNWVISNAVSSIGQKQENEVLENCISSLKLLGSKNSNVI